ncbi:aldo/keto reductase [Amycolatopsis jejuensis]|uniref:aldo/keto reductase n=1 Tax=Amycolatopsis jejuensis TaxID=330084 RepID=UPI0005279821|nr:aldo/keto reductase [Amycolatopsis jejuensis]
MTALGSTARLAGRDVARIGFGALQLERTDVPRETLYPVLHAALDGGVNHLDTAHFYGAANDVIREALHPYPDDLVLVTKVGANRRDGALVAAQQPAELRAQVEENLATLGVERVDVVNLRRIDAPPGIIAEGDQIVDLDDQLAELISLREQGKIGAIGLSNVSADQLRHALPAGITCVQNNYNLLDRTAEPVLDLCREHDLAWVPFFALGARYPGFPQVTEDPVVQEIAQDLGGTPAQVGLAWQLANYEGTLLIQGTTSLEHLAENLAVAKIELPAAALDRLSSR